MFQSGYLALVRKVVLPSSAALGKLAQVVVAVPRAAKAVTQALLVGVQALAGARFFVVRLAMTLEKFKMIYTFPGVKFD